MTAIVEKRAGDGVGRRIGVESRLFPVSDPAIELSRHFRANYPILLDGALPLGVGAEHLVRQARESLNRGRVDPSLLPAAVLRETLASIQSLSRPDTPAGLTAVGPRRARVWWDNSLLDSLDDILAGLDKPRPILRFYDTTGLPSDSGRWNDVFDIDVALDDGGKSIDFWAADRQYVVELGYLHADGRFIRLARTNTAELPREACGHGDPQATAHSNLRPRRRRPDALLAPDAAAREWAEARRDHPDRDFNAELMVHMLYRAFLLEGPRALRRAPQLAPRDEEVLHEEYRQRSRVRRQRPARTKRGDLPAVLVTRLDVARRQPRSALRYPPVPVVAVSRAVDAQARPADGIFASGSERARQSPAVLGNGDLVRLMPDKPAAAFSSLASPVFAAAQTLRRQLAGIQPDASAEAASAGTDRETKKKSGRLRDFGGIESRRFANAGVRFTRMALTLEGRMRPGARLKVAGKLVYADADGHFRLECVLSGRRASIPMRAGTSIGGEARSVINVEWERRGAADGRKSLARL